MKIANAAYDVVFRYLMDDNKVAKLMISALIGEEITKLTFKSTDVPIKKNELPTILMMDFAATILTSQGKEKEIIIELQKVRYYLEVMRFRNYLGKQYANENNVISSSETAFEEGRPILPIFILGEKLTAEEIPVIRVNRCIVDVATNEKLEIQHAFIDALTHDGIFVQLPYVKKKRRTDLEKLLSVFDADGTKKQILNIDETQIPKKYQIVLRRLKKAVEDPEVTESMNQEDAYVNIFAKARLEVEMANKKEQEERRLKEEERRLKEAERRLKEAALEKEREERKLKEEERRLKEEERRLKEAAQIKLALKMLKYEEPISDIMAETGLSEEDIKGLKS